MVARLHLDGDKISSEKNLHDEIEKQLNPPVYGRNLDALDEVLSQMLEPPIEIVWTNAAQSESILGDRFEKFVQVFQDAKDEYQSGAYQFVLQRGDSK